jgi:hypothetical protein
VRPCCKTLAHIALLDYVLGIVKSRQPIESRAEGLGDESSTAGMVTIGSFMDVLKYTNTIFGCDASLENTHCASFVQLSFDDCEGLAPMDDLLTVDRIFG